MLFAILSAKLFYYLAWLHTGERKKYIYIFTIIFNSKFATILKVIVISNCHILPSSICSVRTL